MSSQLIWQLVKNNNCFMHKGLNGVVLSKEPGNLYNVHCYKYSGEPPQNNFLNSAFPAQLKRSQQSPLTCTQYADAVVAFINSWQHRVALAGLANDKAIHIEGDGQGLKVTKLISKHANKPSKAKSSSTRKKSFQRVSHGLNKELDGYRPDLKVMSVLLLSSYVVSQVLALHGNCLLPNAI